MRAVEVKPCSVVKRPKSKKPKIIKTYNPEEFLTANTIQEIIEKLRNVLNK